MTQSKEAKVLYYASPAAMIQGLYRVLVLLQFFFIFCNNSLNSNLHTLYSGIALYGKALKQRRKFQEIMFKRGAEVRKIIAQLIRFGIVGVIATVVDLGVLMFLKEIVQLKVLAASAISFSVSVTVNYILSTLFVFKSNNDNKIKEFLVFVVLSAGGLLLTQLIMWIGTEVMARYYLWVKIIAEIFVPIYNFVTRKIILEKKA